MTTDKSSTSDASSGREHLSHSGHGGSESLALPITGHQLNGHNYLQWAQSVMMFVSGKGKDDLLTGATTIPKKDDPNYRTWRSENNMVMSWLINTMDNEIGQNFMLYGTAKEIWDAVKETYSDSDNTAELLEIESSLHDLRQGDFSVTKYYNMLTSLWQQLDVFEAVEWECPGDAAKFRKIVEKERVSKFLLGLNTNLDDVRGRVFGMRPSPSIREAYSEVCREESRKKVMMGNQNNPSFQNVPESSALVTRGMSPTSESRARKARPWCDYCCRPGHARETCWKIHGKPTDHKKYRPFQEREGRVFSTTIQEQQPMEQSATKNAPFSKAQIEMLQTVQST